MENIKRIFNSPEGHVLISIIWGLGIATLFRKVCVKNCTVVDIVDPASQTDIYKLPNEPTKCVRFVQKFVPCQK